MANEQKGAGNTAGIIVGGCMFIGLGIGLFTKHTSTGLFVGLGVGLLGMAAVQLFYRGKP